MTFNSYIWQLYKNSSEGSVAIRAYSNLLKQITKGKFKLTLANTPFNTTDRDWDFTNIIVGDYSNAEVRNIFEAESLFKEIASGFPVTFYDEEKGVEEDVVFDHSDLLDWLTELSVGLYACFPEYFFPYFFMGQFFLFEQICDTFNIPLPEFPQKKHFDKRLAYYFELCQILYEFRKNQNLSPAELCAFLIRLHLTLFYWKPIVNFPNL